MADESKLLTDAELKEYEIAVHKQQLFLHGSIRYLLADIRRYREWCKRLVGLDGRSISTLAELESETNKLFGEIKAALTDNSSARS